MFAISIMTQTKNCYTVIEKMYTVSNVRENISILAHNQNLLSNDHDYSYIYNKINNRLQYLHGPGRLQDILACNLKNKIINLLHI